VTQSEKQRGFGFVEAASALADLGFREPPLQRCRSAVDVHASFAGADGAGLQP
jgi:hypothetical protein